MEIQIEAYRETQKTKSVLVVDAASSDPDLPGVVAIPVDADHISICKPVDQNAEVYLGIKNFIRTAIHTPKSTQFRNVDTPSILREIALIDQLVDSQPGNLLRKEITNASTSMTIAENDQTTEESEQHIEEFSARIPLKDDEYSEFESVQCLITDIKAARKECAMQRVDRLISELKDRFKKKASRGQCCSEQMQGYLLLKMKNKRPLWHEGTDVTTTSRCSRR